MIKTIINRFKKNGFLFFISCILFILSYFFQLSINFSDGITIINHSPLQVFAEEKLNQSNYFDEFLPNPNFLQEQWNLNLMNIGEAWADGYTGAGIKIAVLDTGFYHQHPDISMAGGESVFPDDPWSYDHSGHGTHIAGIISAKKGTAYQGVAPDANVYGIKIYHKKDTNEHGDVSTDVESVIKGIRQAISLESDIIVISSGLNYHDENLYEIIKEAHDRDIIIIAASGNDNLNVNYPAYYDEVIAVTAIDEELNPALDIIYGSENEFSAPGVNIGGLSIPESSYSYPYIFMSGSSQATPHAAGLAAIFMQKYQVNGEELRKIMQEQAVYIGEPRLFGYGLLYYRSDDSPEQHLSKKEKEETATTKSDKEKSNGDENEDSEVRKPFSSREADTSVEENELKNYRRAVITLNEEGLGKLSGNVLSLIEGGGTVELIMDNINSLRLTDDQIYEIRQNNISLLLSKEEIAWKIPASNFVPGQATLRFYEGEPLGIADLSSNFSYIYTTSIFQKATRQGVYPGEMEVRFNLEHLKVSHPDKLKAAYFNKEQEEWVSLEKELDQEKITIKTKYTGAIGFIDPDKVNRTINFTNDDKHVLPSVFYFSTALFALTVVLFALKKSSTKSN